MTPVRLVLSAFFAASLLPFPLPWVKPEPPAADVPLVLTQPAPPDPPPDGSIMRIVGPRESPARWRTSEDPISETAGRLDKPLEIAGLRFLNVSGSGQFSLDQFYKMRETLAGKAVTVIDLRAEPHGFINAAAIAWGPPASGGGSAPTVERIEEAWLDHTARAKRATATFYAPDAFADQSSWQPIELKFDVRSVSTEARLVDTARWGYFRVAAPVSGVPPDAEVDRFVKFVREVEEGAWLHFHCDTGRGRTTFFLTLYDMMRNYVRAPREHIVERQRRLGGSDLLAARAGTAEAQRAAFLERFFSYCWAAGPEFRQSWSAWSRASLRSSERATDE